MFIPPVREIFVFGSNLAGIHGAGSALVAAKKHGAVRGVGRGLTGNAYALPTKDEDIQTLPFHAVRDNIADFIWFAKQNPRYGFKVVTVGCMLAGFRHAQIAPEFIGAPSNCSFDLAWKPWLRDGHSYWGTFQ